MTPELESTQSASVPNMRLDGSAGQITLNAAGNKRGRPSKKVAEVKPATKGKPAKKDKPAKAAKVKQPKKSAARPSSKTKADAAPKKKKVPASARESKQEQVIELMRSPDGVTAAAIMKLTGWQAHTVRGFMAGTVGKKLGIKFESFKNAAGDRTYRIGA